MLTLAGQEVFKAPADQVFALVTNLDTLVDCIPDLQSHERIDATHLKCVVRPGFSFLRMKLKIDLSIDVDPSDRRATMTAESRGIGAAMDVESRLAVVEHTDGCQLNWSAVVVRMSGLVATVSGDLVRAAAEQVIRESWAKLHMQLEAG